MTRPRHYVFFPEAGSDGFGACGSKRRRPAKQEQKPDGQQKEVFVQRSRAVHILHGYSLQNQARGTHAHEDGTNDENMPCIGRKAMFPLLSAQKRA